MTAATRTPQEVFQHHAEVLIAGDLEGIVSDYADDAVFITPSGTLHGKDGVREGFTKLLADVPDAEWAVPTQIFEGDVLFIEWTAETPTARGTYGVDTFVFSDDGIRVWMDDDRIVDRWTPHESAVDTVPVTGGKRRLKVEYYEIGGFAELRFEILRR